VRVERVKIDSVFIEQYQRDTVYRLDSVIIRTIADTVYKDAWRYIYRDRVVRDTVLKVRRDTVPRVVRVEKELSRMDRIKLSLGEVALYAILVAAAVAAMWFMKRLKGW
jgi:hypothetical protein